MDDIFAAGMVSEENSERPERAAPGAPEDKQTAPRTQAHETPAALPALCREPAAVQPRLRSAAASVEGHLRARLLDAYDALLETAPALSLERAARAIGVPISKLWRLLKRRKEGKPLQPDFHKTGRKLKHPHLATLLEIDAVRVKIDTLYIATFGASSEAAASGRRTGKVSVALARFAEEPECPPDLAERLRLGALPAPLVAYLRRITPEMEARVRGEKNFKLNGIVSRRDDTVRLPDGRRAPITAGFLVEFDDMSSNQPFYVEHSDGSTLLSRQGLYARDVKSGRWLGVELIARPREAYRAVDILRFIRRLMMIYGKFDVLRLERGIWAARSLKGWKITDNGAVEEDLERPPMDQVEHARLQAGLEAIGVHVQSVTSAHRKGALESSFNYLQTILATYTTDLNNMGRYAGEFQCVEKRIRQVRAGSHSPGHLCFAHIDELATRVEKSMDFINRRARNGDPENTADLLWSRDLAARPLPPVTEIDLAAFLPEIRERAIEGGCVTLQVDGQVHDFRADLFASLGHGYRVFVRFDPGEPTLGAAIYNRETSSANHFELRQGDFICFARWEMPGPQIDLPHARGLAAVTPQSLYGAGVEDDGYARRKSQEKFVRTAFRALPKPGQPAVRTAEVRDGRGNLARVSDSSPSPGGEGRGEGGPQTDKRLQLPAPAPARAREIKDSYAALFGG